VNPALEAISSCFDIPALSDEELRQIGKLVKARAGIALHEGKRALVIARLQRRLRAGGFQSFGEYLRFVEHDSSGEELVALLDAIATNHTSFFRERQHFAYLTSRVVPEWRSGPKAARSGWSAACSTGEEPYTIAVTLREAMGADAPQLLASDLSTKALALAANAVYRMDRVLDVPASLLHKYFERGSGEQEGFARVAADIRRLVRFEHRNLIEIDDLGCRFDFIFCRNVMIYFDRDVQQRVVSMLERHLTPGGHLFVAHSETLNGLTHRLRWIGPAIYQKDVR
jgi:chemotaxis protein methyltransferase CheR